GPTRRLGGIGAPEPAGGRARGSRDTRRETTPRQPPYVLRVAGQRGRPAAIEARMPTVRTPLSRADVRAPFRGLDTAAPHLGHNEVCLCSNTPARIVATDSSI